MAENFYNELSSYYHLIFQDWESSIDRQAVILNSVIKSEWNQKISSIVDVSCGIGTQSIGLAKLGYKVEASDLSMAEIERAKIDAAKNGLDIKFSVSDMRKVSSHYNKQFDLLISCDNSIPHFLTDEDISTAFNEFYKCLNPGGDCLITLRDYDKEKRDGIQIKPYDVKVHNGNKYIIVQTWEFHGDIYELNIYMTCDNEKQNTITTQVFQFKYYAVSTMKIIDLMKKANFSNVKIMKCDYYQPVIVGTKSV